MNILQRYLLRQVAAILVMAVIVFTFVLMLGNALREILPLLVTGEVGFGIVVRALALLIPFVLAVALPMAMLAATLLAFGRFSADQELTAARASGVSLLSLAGPVLVLSLLLCGVSAAMNMEVAPRCRVAYNNLRSDLRAALAEIKLPAGRFVEFPADKPGRPGFIIYVARNRNEDLRDILLYRFGDGTNLSETVRAPSGRLIVDTTNQTLELTLSNATTMSLPSGQMFLGEITQTLDLSSEKSEWKPGISDMTFGQLREQLRQLKRRLRLPSLETPATAPDSRGKKRAAKKPLADLTEPVRIQIHRQIAFSFACFGFTLMGIPLAIRVHRRETNIGVAITLGLVAVYYTMLVFIQSLASHPEFAPHVLIWAPNFVFQAAGAVLLWRANRGI